MDPARHPDFRMQTLAIGRERAPLIVVDQLVADPEELVTLAATKHYSAVDSYYPGVRARAPLSYQQFILATFRDAFRDVFGLGNRSVRFTSCHFSLVTRQPAELVHLQRVPHVDSLSSEQLAFIHYLFRQDLGGTAFYRHRATGFEFIDAERSVSYFETVKDEKEGPDSPAPAYINGDTALYEQIGRQDGVFNRLLMYRRNSLHSGCLSAGSTLDADPRKGRLSINGFLA
jgi:Family of unknown function (DUF6445)